MIHKISKYVSEADLKIENYLTLLDSPTGSGKTEWMFAEAQERKTNLEYLEIERRCNNLDSRGVVLAEGQTLKNLYDERIPLYEKYSNITLENVSLDSSGAKSYLSSSSIA